MFQRITQRIYDKIAGSQIVYDIFCDAAEDAGMLPDPTEEPILRGRRRRRRRRRRR